VVGCIVTPLERLLAAAEHLADDVTTLLLSHHDLHLCDGQGVATGTIDPGDILVVAKAATEVFAVGTDTTCVKADSGTRGEVVVQVPTATYALPLAACTMVAITPGTLPGPPQTAATAPTQVPAGAGTVTVSIADTLPPGLYMGHLVDASANLRRPFLIFLDGLT
jgi:hypothetical protein